MALVTEIAASVIIEKLVDTVVNYANLSWWPSAKSVKEEATKLQAALPQIRAVLAAVQGDRIKQRSRDFDACLWQFRDAIEAADYVLDEINYYELEEKIKERDIKLSGPLSGCKRKLIDLVKSAFINDGVLNKMREAVKGLEDIGSNSGQFLQLANSLNQQVQLNSSRETGSSFDERMVVGREKEKEMIVQWLTAQPSGDDEHGALSCFAIFGTGGMGKTTLAQIVCKDLNVISKFDIIVWVCVSDNSGIVDANTIIKKIIEDITEQSCNLNNFNTLQDTLNKKLASKKFLLVLDDVWRDDTLSIWKKIVDPLRCRETGSKILLTTRMESVGKMVASVTGGENKILNLAGLEENDFLTLFYKHAFADIDPSKQRTLYGIGIEIAKKLYACPLAAEVIGGVLNNNANSVFWNNLLNDDILNRKESNDHIMEILKLSYYHLPSHLQLCFRYCSIFPQDYKFNKVELVKMWMGSGLIPQYAHEKRRPEDVANEYLDELTRKSFFHIKPNHDLNRGTYVIHDLLHDLARCVSKGECLRITCDDVVNIPKTVRHLCIGSKTNSVLGEIRKLDKLQTLVIADIKDKCINLDLKAKQELNEILLEMKNLRSLSLTIRKDDTIPSVIGDLMHLRYLSFSCDTHDFSEGHVPFWSIRSLCRLYHLEVMQFKNCRNRFSDIEETELHGICNLTNLRYIDVDDSGGFTCEKIPQIGRLSSLRELDRFEVKNESGFRIGELKNLTSLCKLHLCGLSNIKNPGDSIQAKMDKKVNLETLWISFGLTSTIGNVDIEIADNLKPPSGLNKLIIANYKGTRSPNWLIDSSCCNLKYVQLYRCDGWKDLPPLGKLNSLEHLELHHMNVVTQVDHSLYGNSDAPSHVFPSLRRLVFSEMPEWENWVGIEGRLFFPCLEELKISSCPKLKKLPTLPSTLKILNIFKTSLDTLPVLYQVPENGIIDAVPFRPPLSFLKIGSCPKIVSLLEWRLVPNPEDLHALTTISIELCSDLVHMPNEFLAKLPSLTDLVVQDCPKLVTHEIKLPTMLKKLTFGSCGDLEPSFIRSLQDLTSLTFLKMDRCENIQSLPPVFARLAALRDLEITSCNALASLDGIEMLIGLKSLSVCNCKNLSELSLQQPPLPYHNNQVDSTSHHLKLDFLRIGHISLLLMEPLRSLRFTRSLCIDNAIGMVSLPEQWLLQNRGSIESLFVCDASPLESLPPIMERLSSLRRVHIVGASNLSSLPNIPASVRLCFYDCNPELKELCQSMNISCEHWDM